MTLSNKALALTLETQLSIALDHISKLRRQLSVVDMRDQIGNEPWFSQAGHPYPHQKTQHLDCYRNLISWPGTLNILLKMGVFKHGCTIRKAVI